ncbi:MAG: hypothetical protein DWG82_00605 [Chloroflexi bacterium]|nr:hypothetical protein [Chloroflexota bacterium]
MIRRRTSVLIACFTGLLLAGCAIGGPSVETSDIFETAPWQPGESLRYQVANTAGEIIGTGVLSSELDEDRILIRQEYRELETAAGVTPNSDTTSVWVDASTFRPIEGQRAIVRRDDGGASEERWQWRFAVEEGQPILISTHIEGSREPRERTLRLRDHYYDNESSLWLWRSVDLGEEHEDYYVSVNPLEASQQTIHLRVPQTESVVVPAGEFDSYRLLFRTGRAVRTAWIEAEAPHRVLRWDNGDVTLELMP